VNEALERAVEEEDFRLRMELGGGAAMVAIGAMFLLLPFLAGLSLPFLSWPLTVWAVVNLPLLTLAVLAWRRGRMPLGGGRFLEGRLARKAAIALVLANLLLFFGGSLIQWIWKLLTPASW
jgi:hypothetical protein